MYKSAIKDVLHGGLMELMKNHQYYYYSAVGENYSHWTEEGKEVLTEFMHVMAWKMLESEQQELNQRAKELVLRNLKGEKP
jgi:hypothetical protein